MMSTKRLTCSVALLWVVAVASVTFGQEWKPLFNGKDLTGWKVPEGDNGHWKVVDGVIDYDAMSEASGEKHLWSEQSFGDCELEIEWRMKKFAGELMAPIMLPDGSYKLDAAGEKVTVTVPPGDSGIYLRGYPKSQLNIWCWPIGSGEIWGYRTNAEMPADIRAACVPKVCADKPVGEWNRFNVVVRGNRVTVKLNGQVVIDNVELAGLPAEGPIALQHHGGVDKRTGELRPSSSLVQFRNIRVRPVKP